MKGVILAAGVGSRLSPYTDMLPKALMPISLDEQGRFRAIIEQIIHQMRCASIVDIIVVVNYKADMITSYVGDGSRLGVHVDYVRQDVLDGNGGAFFQAQPFFNEQEAVFITDCDNFLTEDTAIQQFRHSFERLNPDVSVAVLPVENIEKYAIIRLDAEGKPEAVFEKPSDRTLWGNLAKSGMMIVGPALSMADRSISQVKSGEFTTTGLIDFAIKNSLHVEIFHIPGDFVDIGTWVDYIRILKSQL